MILYTGFDRKEESLCMQKTIPIKTIWSWILSVWRHNSGVGLQLWPSLVLFWRVLWKCCSIIPAWCHLTQVHNKVRRPSLAILCWLQGGISWPIKVLGLLFEVTWRHNLRSCTDGGSAVGRLKEG